MARGRQTAQLDGETNLKLRQAIDCTTDYFDSPQACANFAGYIECEAPSEFFDKFTGIVQMGAGEQSFFVLGGGCIPSPCARGGA